MDQDRESTSSEITCRLCNQQKSKYTCPKCGINYCTVKCYRSYGHSQCSENFFKECIVNEVKSRQPKPKVWSDPNMQLKKMLKDEKNEKENSDSDDSDDESHYDLMNRMKNVDLNDAPSVWNRLKEREKIKFQCLIHSGEVVNFLPKWSPWWEGPLGNNLVDMDDENLKSSKIPLVQTKIPLLSSLMVKKPHHSAINGMINILYGYAYVSRLFMQDWTGDTKPVIETLFLISPILETKVVFNTAKEALEIAHTSASNLVDASPELRKLVENDVKLIIKQTKFVMASLSDINCLLLTGIKQETVLKRRVFLATKKIEFYLSYIAENGVPLLEL